MAFSTSIATESKKKDNIQPVTSTQDFHQVTNLGGHEYLSARAWYEVDCAPKKIRQVSLEVFSDNMAMGGTIYSKTEAQAWTAAADDSHPCVIRKGVCGKTLIRIKTEMQVVLYSIIQAIPTTRSTSLSFIQRVDSRPIIHHTAIAGDVRTSLYCFMHERLKLLPAPMF